MRGSLPYGNGHLSTSGRSKRLLRIEVMCISVCSPLDLVFIGAEKGPIRFQLRLSMVGLAALGRYLQIKLKGII